ncbi:MAG: hypothetical protein ISS36_03080 [Candidatus Aenigmarchaeota archaeon]|nr:hypothetical protein [Candidatus Aenigmarchaeota archaeon]
MRKIYTFLVIGLFTGFLLGGYLGSKTVYVYTETIQTNTINPNENISLASIKVPAVDQNGLGVATDLVVGVKPGTGKNLVDINSLLFWVDTQYSIRTAVDVAESITGKDASIYDFSYGINANASLIGGGSAGAALTIATIAALRNTTINPEIMITGTINPDGSIGPIGGVLEKAKAAKDVGAKIFLVPSGQAYEITYKSRRHCEHVGFNEICTIETIPIKRIVGNEVDIEIKEVGDINDALEYFF